MNMNRGKLVFLFLLGVLTGGVLTHFLTESTAGVGLGNGGLSPEGSQAQVAMAQGAGALLQGEASGVQRQVAKAKPLLIEEVPVSQQDVQGLVAGLQVEVQTAEVGSGTISGHVLDSEGLPLAGVVIRMKANRKNMSSRKPSSVARGAPDVETLEEAVRKAAELYHKSRARSLETKTDSAGAYRLGELPDRTWRLSAYLANYHMEPNSSSRKIKVGGELDFTGTPVLQVSVRVLEVDGTDAHNAYLQVRPSGSNSRAKKYSWSPEEAYLRLVPGKYMIAALSGGVRRFEDAEAKSEFQEVLITSGTTPSEVRLQLNGRLSIRGTLGVAQGNPHVDYYHVRMLALEEDQEVDLALLLQSGARESIGAGDEFTFQDLQPGRHLVGVSRSWSTPIVDHLVIEVLRGQVRCDLQIPVVDLSSTLQVTVLGVSGEPLDDISFQFDMVDSRGGGTNGRVESLWDGDRSHFVFLGGKEHKAYFGDPDQSTYRLTATSKTLGATSVDLSQGQTELTLAFVVPGSLVVTIGGYRGSNFEGRIRVKAIMKGQDRMSGYFMPNDKVRVNTKGVWSTDGLAPGTYLVSMGAGPKDSTEPWYRGNMLETIEVQIHAGENTARLQIPTLYGLRVHRANAKQGATMNLIRQWGERSHTNAELDANGYASWEGLHPGRYTLRGGGPGQMELLIPSGDIEFKAMQPNALRVYITSASGDLAKVGFQDGDMIIGKDGKEFTDRTYMGLYGKLINSESAEVNFLILRGSRRLQLLVKGSQVGNRSDMGGRFTPTTLE